MIKCPVCRDVELYPAQADVRPASLRCEQCGGQFIRGEVYYQWIDSGGDSGERQDPPEQVGEVVDVPNAKLCPECGMIMRRYNVGHGVSFVIDRCSSCAGLWFDANEWETLQARQLHDRIHFVFSHAWQAGLLRKNLDDQARQRLIERIGQSDYDELQRVLGWIENHPHRDELAAHLIERLRTTDVQRRRKAE